ncbi:hypothetical protein F4808DRAFT_456606 [Astrocystis sublimbata]|nr:hypothetical protein F4808DRAFT_456606 [Astrocystis sublimbata]
MDPPAQRPLKPAHSYHTRSSGALLTTATITEDVYSPNVSTSEFSEILSELEGGKEKRPKRVRLSLLDDSGDEKEIVNNGTSSGVAGVEGGGDGNTKGNTRIEVVLPAMSAKATSDHVSPAHIRKARRLVGSRRADVGMIDDDDDGDGDSDGLGQVIKLAEKRKRKRKNAELDLFGGGGDEDGDEDEAEGLVTKTSPDVDMDIDSEEDVSRIPSVPSKNAKKPVTREDIDFSTGAAARYLEFLNRQGLASGPGLASRPHSSSFSSSEDEANEEQEDEENQSDFINPLVEVPFVEEFDGHGQNHGENGSSVKDDPVDDTYNPFTNFRINKSEDYSTATKNDNNTSAAGLNDSYTVYRKDKMFDNLLTNQLLTIGRALNFMARARVSGIPVDDFEALAAMSTEEWADLVDAPEDAGEYVAKRLLRMPMFDICLLSEQATKLQREMRELGVII